MKNPVFMLDDQKAPFFTIICPNYKTEPFLEQCLLSVKNQTFQDFECILINDGSPGIALFSSDKKVGGSSDYWFREDFKNRILPEQSIKPNQHSKFIFQELVGNDNRFRFFEHDNIGQGPTRNRGIIESKGYRVVFLDCDDFLHPNYLQNAFDAISKREDSEGEIFYTGIKNYEESKVTSFEKNQKHLAKNNNLATIFTFPTWLLGPVNYFWRLDILKKYNVQYPGGRGEDMKIFMNAIVAYRKEFGGKVAKNFIHIGESGYFYRLFPFQNYRAPHFEEELFEELTQFVANNLFDYDRFGIRIAILARLYIVRFGLYKKKLETKNVFLSLLYNITAKFLTVFSLLLSGFKKIYV